MKDALIHGHYYPKSEGSSEQIIVSFTTFIGATQHGSTFSVHGRDDCLSLTRELKDVAANLERAMNACPECKGQSNLETLDALGHCQACEDKAEAAATEDSDASAEPVAA